MFKKKPSIKGFSNIKSSFRRDVLDAICTLYNLPKEKLSAETAREILPNPTQEARFLTVKNEEGSIFMDDRNIPTWFSAFDKNEEVFYPALYTLWRCPYLLPIVLTHDVLIKEVLSMGANLMLPGTVPPFEPRLTAGTVVAIASSKSPHTAMAVGVLCMDLVGIDSVIGKQGEAVRILHIINDELFKMAKKDVAIPQLSEASLEVPWAEDEAGEGDEAGETGGTVSVSEAQNVLESTENLEGTSQENSENNPEQTASSSLAEGVSKLTLEDIDNFFYRALLQSIATSHIETPISSSNFMSNHVLKNLPPVDSNHVNIKKTSWKKAAKFLKAMEKANLLKVKGKGDDLVILSLVGSEDDRIKNFVPHRVKKATNSAQPVATPKKSSDKLQIVKFFKPTPKSNFSQFMPSNVVSPFFKDEIKAALTEYVRAHDLVNKQNPSSVLLDDVLTKAVGLKSAAAMDRSEILPKTLAHSFSEFDALVKPDQDIREAASFRGGIPPIKIITEMVIGRKLVTRVLGYENYYVRTEEFNSELKVKCSASTSIGQNRQNPKITEISVQGPHAKKIIDLLATKGVRPQWIEEENKVKPKKKK
ncbi:unnamed protein product [Kuraishia capsulata CBS 1993]|uniref:SUI1 domain-containing protein n=1 Tax=Kuraishia capsulata CBS 1993 TaxID=1382522 RepID=W6MKS3_9ASCO|nr:uncharacterized protein KUCA_T00001326001 [Kuraishia capsulata CBS 1993]CDK25357.1 unnamed protein product [Kuraishia capsulata CBS 1993]